MSDAPRMPYAIALLPRRPNLQAEGHIRQELLTLRLASRSSEGYCGPQHEFERVRLDDGLVAASERNRLLQADVHRVKAEMEEMERRRVMDEQRWMAQHEFNVQRAILH